MERTQELFEKIDAYLKGKLESDDLKSFKKTLAYNKELQEEIEKYKLVQTALKNRDSIDFRKKLQQIDGELKREESTEKNNTSVSWLNWKIAAVFITLIGVSSLWYLQNSVEEDLFSSYYTPYPMSDLTRGQDITPDATSLKKMTLNYRNKEYQKVIAFFENKLDTITNDRLKLYLGNSYLNTGQEDKAIIAFQSIHVKSAFYQDAQWFLALTYIKVDEQVKAIPILKKLSAFTNLYTHKASKLVDAL